MSFSSIAQRTNGPSITYTWFNDIRTAGIAVETSLTAGGWAKYTVTHTQLQTAALTNDILLLTLPVKGVVERIIAKHSTAFAGTSITAYKIDIGISGELDRYLSQFDVFQAVGDDTFESVSLQETPSFASTTGVRIKATSVGANLSASTAGSIDIWVKTATLP